MGNLKSQSQWWDNESDEDSVDGWIGWLAKMANAGRLQELGQTVSAPAGKPAAEHCSVVHSALLQESVYTGIPDICHWQR